MLAAMGGGGPGGGANCEDPPPPPEGFITSTYLERAPNLPFLLMA